MEKKRSVVKLAPPKKVIFFNTWESAFCEETTAFVSILRALQEAAVEFSKFDNGGAIVELAPPEYVIFF